RAVSSSTSIVLFPSVVMYKRDRKKRNLGNQTLSCETYHKITELARVQFSRKRKCPHGCGHQWVSMLGYETVHSGMRRLKSIQAARRAINAPNMMSSVMTSP